MILCIDAGNTRVKFGIHAQAGWQLRDAIAHDSLAAPAELVEQIAARVHALPVVPSRILACSVAGDPLLAAITALGARWNLPVEWLRSSPNACGVRNGYARPEQLGNDRWAALIAARSRVEQACVVVMAGTATTVDVLDADGNFRGGLVLPGLTLMRRALATYTARLPVAQGSYQSLPDNTDDAIVSGCLAATAGAIAHMQGQAGSDICLLSGGDAQSLGTLLSGHVLTVPDLVLEGLVRVAAEARQNA